MKKINYLLMFSLMLTLTYCSKDVDNNTPSYDEFVESYEPISKELVSDFSKGTIHNFENTGVNFHIKKDNSLTTRLISNNKFHLVIITELTNKEVVESVLLYEFEDNGDVKITHYSEDYIFAILHINKKGKLYEIDMPHYNSITTRSLRSWYDCVNKEYQKNKKRISEDMLNDITCTVLAVPCAVMNALVAIDKC